MPQLSESEQQTLVQRLDKLNEIGVALSAHFGSESLMELILQGAKELTHADGGTLYTVTPDKSLSFEIVRTTSLNLAWGGPGHNPVPFGEIPLYLGEEPNDKMVACYASVHGKTVNIEDAYETKDFDLQGTYEFDRQMCYRSTSFLTVPLLNHDKEVIGVLQLLNATDPKTGDVVPFSKADQHLVESLASQAAVAMSNQRLIKNLNGMLEAFIWAMAEAIDEKSPYTGGHCRRVPIIANQIAEAINTSKTGPLAERQFTPEELYELNIAALLHDCGKVTTPVHVVDKATRLETIVDRIENIDQRFEWLHQQAEKELLQRKLEALEKGEKPDPSWDGEFQQQQKQWEDDRKFLRECNLGDTVMGEERRERVQRIAQYPLKTQEGAQLPFLSPDELHNLSIPRGTLNAEEREAINHHVVCTIKMLRNLPYPRHLSRVAEIAGSHHEHMDGSGYPQGLTGEQMSLQARLLAVADIFEALTAADRPYKEPLPMSTVLKILEEKRDAGHIDSDVLDVFLEKKVWLRYGQEYLRPEQLDITP